MDRFFGFDLGDAESAVSRLGKNDAVPPEMIRVCGEKSFITAYANLENGERFETYAIPGARGSGVCCLNGAAAWKGKVGDRLIVMAFAQVPAEEAAAFRPSVVRIGENNKAC